MDGDLAARGLYLLIVLVVLGGWALVEYRGRMGFAQGAMRVARRGELRQIGDGCGKGLGLGPKGAGLRLPGSQTGGGEGIDLRHGQ